MKKCRISCFLTELKQRLDPLPLILVNHYLAKILFAIRTNVQVTACGSASSKSLSAFLISILH